MADVVLLPMKVPDNRSLVAAGVSENEGEDRGIGEDGLPLISDAELYVLVNKELAAEGLAPYATVVEMLMGLREHYKYMADRSFQIINSSGWKV